MALIFDPDDLNQGVELTYDTGAKTIALNIAGNLSTDGVTLKALYSATKEEWKNDPLLIPFPFPFTPITDESFELKDGWDFANDATRYLIRTSGWSVVDTSGQTTQQWSGIIGLGTIEANDQVYFDQGVGITSFQLTGQVNQAVQIFDDPNGDGNTVDGFDYRAEFAMYVREQGQLFDSSSLSDIGVSVMAPIAYRFPLSTGDDLNVGTPDNDIITLAPYTGMSINYYATAQSRLIGGVNYDFGIVIDGNNGTAEQIYEFVQYQLRQNTDINALGNGAVVGTTASQLLRFVGSNLETLCAENPNGGGSGVFIDNFQAADTNRITFSDNTCGALIGFPFVAVVTVAFNNNLQNDADAIYRVFYTSVPSGDYGTSNAILVEDAGSVQVLGNISGATSIQFDYDYDGNVQGGRTPGADAAITVVAIGLESGQYVSAEGTITRSTQNSVSLVAPLERNYENP